jgi:YHS domain-containing protein
MRKATLFVLLGVTWAFLAFGWSIPGTVLAADQVRCPVLGNPIDSKVFVDYQGKRVYFCCAGCIDQFRSDPEKYLKKMEAEGVTPQALK